MTIPLKDKRIELRLTAAQKDVIETAAALEGRTVTDFSTEILTEHAEEVIQRDRQVRVDAEHFQAFLDIMERPAATIDGLKDLLTRTPVFRD